MSWSEILIVAIVALIVVGPKDLPGMFKQLGQFTAKAKRMARDFSRAMEDAADDAGIVDVQKTFKAATNPAKAAMDSVTDSVKKAVDFDAMDPDSETAKMAAGRETAKARVEAVKAANAAAEAQAKEFSETAKAKAASKKPAAKKPAAKKPAAKKPAAKPAAKKPAAKTAAKTPAAAKKPAAKTAAKSTAKTAAKTVAKTAAKKPAKKAES